MTVEWLDYLQVDAELTLGDGTIMQNRFRYLADFPDGAESDAACVTALETRFGIMYATLAGAVQTDVEPNLYEVSKVAWQVPGPAWWKTAATGTFLPTTNYTSIVDALPNQCSPYITVKTSRPRTFGRKYLPPFVEDTQAEGVLTAAAVTAMTNFATSYLYNIPLGGNNFLRPGVGREATGDWYGFTVAVVSDVIGSQRRRKPGVGI